MSLEFSIKEILSAFMVLFAIIDITGSIPIIIDLKNKGNVIKPVPTVLGSFAVFIAFLYAGDGLLSLFGVDIQSFAVAGAIVILVLAIEMILGVELNRQGAFGPVHPHRPAQIHPGGGHHPCRWSYRPFA